MNTEDKTSLLAYIGSATTFVGAFFDFFSSKPVIGFLTAIVAVVTIIKGVFDIMVGYQRVREAKEAKEEMKGKRKSG